MISLGDVTSTSSSVEALCDTLRSYGVARIPDFITTKQTQKLLEEAEIATAAFANYKNPYGPCSRFSLEQLPPHLAHSRDIAGPDFLEPLPPQFVETRCLLGGQFFRGVVTTYLGTRAGFMEVVAFTRDCNPDPRAVYGKLHYDRRHQLKFIVYLNDVDETNGAFGCIPASHGLGRTLFHKGWRQVLNLKTDDPAEIEEAAAEVPEDRPEYRLVPCVLENMSTIGDFIPQRDRLSIDGPAGTLVAFDTHLLHYGGMVATSKERWTLKGHTFAIADGEPQ